MAFINQRIKKNIVAEVKPVLEKYRMKATFAVRNYSTLTVTLKSGPLDLPKNEQISHYWLDNHFSGKELAFLKEMFEALKKGGEWFDKSDISSDYFNTAFYMYINVGNYDKSYVRTAS